MNPPLSVPIVTFFEVLLLGFLGCILIGDLREKKRWRTVLLYESVLVLFVFHPAYTFLTSFSPSFPLFSSLFPGKTLPFLLFGVYLLAGIEKNRLESFLFAGIGAFLGGILWVEPQRLFLLLIPLWIFSVIPFPPKKGEIPFLLFLFFLFLSFLPFPPFLEEIFRFFSFFYLLFRVENLFSRGYLMRFSLRFQGFLMILGLATFLVLERSLIGIGYKEISPLFMRLYFLFTGGAIVGAVGLGVLLYQAQKSLEEKERELRQRNLDLMETSRMALLGEAMVGVAHDLATPLGNALLIVEELEEKVNGKEVKEDFSLLKNQILKVGQFLHKGLDLAKRKRGVMRDSASPYRAFLLAKEFLSPRLNRLQVTLEEKGLKDLPPLPATEIEWVEVFLNLLTNSLDALSPGGRIVVAGERTKEKVKIVVEDTGEGIPEEHLRKVFDPFFTTKEKGTGLGLTIVRQMVERVGGRVWLESKVREGTRVFLEFPLKEGE